MNIIKRKMQFTLLFFLSVSAGMAQTPADAVMMKPGEICLGAFYNHNSWNEYWEGELLRDNGNIGTLTTHTVSAGFILGIVNRLNVIVSAPFIITQPSAGTVIGSKGFQDVALMLKASLVEKQFNKGTLSVLTTAGFTTPLSNYFPEEPFAIGLGCADASLRGIVQYKFNIGLYTKIQAAFHLRGSSFITPVYYYTTQAISTNEIDMPNASDYSFAIGCPTKNKMLKAEIELSGLTTFRGFDIRRQDGGFPSNDMEALRAGVNADYFPPFIKGLAVHVGSAYTLQGRNIGKSFIIGGGISYLFDAWQPKKPEPEPVN